jgi:hypothetical protein
MRYAIALAAIPLPLLMWAAWPKAAQPITVRAVATEGVRAVRMDDSTFRARWSGVNALAPATVVREVPVEVVSVRPQSPPAVRIVRRASLRSDVCAKHGMRRVVVMRGRWQGWRCRR